MSNIKGGFMLSIAEHLEPDIQTLPNYAGIYVFYNHENYPLYIGKSKSIKKRVLSHVADAKLSARKAKLMVQAVRIGYEHTAGEYTALFREAELIKQYAPLHNKKLRKLRNFLTLKINQGTKKLEYVNCINGEDLSQHYGLFKSKRLAVAKLTTLCEKQKICKKLCGLSSTAPCFNYQLKQCHGSCQTADYSAQHPQLLKNALGSLKLQQWPYAGLVALEEKCAHTGLIQYILLYKWCFLGIVNSLNNLTTIVQAYENRRFDKDFYYLSLQALQKIMPQNLELAN